MTPYFKEQLGCEGATALSATQPAQAAQSDWGAQQFKAPVYPPDGTESPFTVINLGSGKVQMGDSIHDGRLPALWFGINGQGMGHEEIMNREARPGETLAVVTFANVEGLDVLLEVIQRIRREKFPEAQAAQSEPASPQDMAVYQAIADGYPGMKAAQGAGEVVAPKLIGWRTENFLWETDDVEKARNWEPNIGVLPIFEGDPNTKLYTHPTPAQPAPVVLDVDALTDKIASMLHGTHHCLRVWEAWQIGTMSEDDFEPVGESDTPREIAEAILEMLAATPAPTAQAAQQGEK